MTRADPPGRGGWWKTKLEKVPINQAFSIPPGYQWQGCPIDICKLRSIAIAKRICQLLLCVPLGVWRTSPSHRPVPLNKSSFCPFTALAKQRPEKSTFCSGLWEAWACEGIPPACASLRAAFRECINESGPCRVFKSHSPPRCSHHQFYACVCETSSPFITQNNDQNHKSDPDRRRYVQLRWGCRNAWICFGVRPGNEQSEQTCTTSGPVIVHLRKFSSGDIQKFNKALCTKSSIATLFIAVKNESV